MAEQQEGGSEVTAEAEEGERPKTCQGEIWLKVERARLLCTASSSLTVDWKLQ